MSDVIGLVLHEDRIDCAVVRRRLGTPRVLETFSLGAEENPGEALAVRLRELRVRTRRVHIGIPRRRAVVKAIEFPQVPGAELRRMVGFELERHLPFPASDALFDFYPLLIAPGRPVRVLLVAAERRFFERVSHLVREAGLTPRLVDVTIHSLGALVAGAGGKDARESRVVMHLDETEAEVVVARRGRPFLSRAFPVPAEPKERGPAVAVELRRTLATLDPEERRLVADATISGDLALAETDWGDLPARTAIRLPGGLDEGSPLLPAVAMALRRPRGGPLRTNLVPDELKPQPFPWPLAATVALGAIVLLLALAIPGVTDVRERQRLAELSREVDKLGPRVREVEKLVETVNQTRREVETLRSFEAQHVGVLPVLRELTELLPADVWLTNLSVDRKGFELSGFAASASQLIPLLEASPTLAGVEFTSPVTKGRDREQFRLKASWERPPATGPETPAAPAVGARPTRPRTSGTPGARR
jgi:general secretion pathway protein L